VQQWCRREAFPRQAVLCGRNGHGSGREQGWQDCVVLSDRASRRRGHGHPHRRHRHQGHCRSRNRLLGQDSCAVGIPESGWRVLKLTGKAIMSTLQEFRRLRAASGERRANQRATGVPMLPAQTPSPTGTHMSRSPGTPCSSDVRLRARGRHLA